MIRNRVLGDELWVASPAVLRELDSVPGAPAAELVRGHFRYVWRLLRRLGLPEADADDVAQQVFLATMSRLDDNRPGRERAFLYGVALNFAARFRKSSRRTRSEVELVLEGVSDGRAAPDELVDQHRARRLLDEILARLDDELREVLVLYEIEQLSSAEIAEITALPSGTVASRLRRAREEFAAEVRRLEARADFASARAHKERP